MKRVLGLIFVLGLFMVACVISFADSVDITDEVNVVYNYNPSSSGAIVVATPNAIQVTSQGAITVDPFVVYATMDNDEITATQIFNGDQARYTFGQERQIAEVVVNYAYEGLSGTSDLSLSYRTNGQWMFAESYMINEGSGTITFNLRSNGSPANCDAIELNYTENGPEGLLIKETSIFEENQKPPSGDSTMLLASAQPNINVNAEFDVTVSYDSVSKTGVSDFSVWYDKSKLEFVSATPVSGQQLAYSNTANSTMRFISVSESKNAFVTGNGPVMNLKFKAIGEGNATVKISKALIANLETQSTIDTSLLGNLRLNVAQNNANDVNSDGEINLIDLAITAWYQGFASDSVPSNYHVDQDKNNIVDFSDLTAVLALYLK